MTVRIALCQTRTPATQVAALAQLEPMIRDAAGAGAQVVLTPEGSNLLQRARDRLLVALKPMHQDPVVIGLQGLAASLEVWIDIGSTLVLSLEGRAVNRQILLSPTGQIAAYYDKLHMFDVDLPNGEVARESSLYQPGDRAVIAGAAGLRLGLTICYDLRFPALYRALASGGAQAITVPAAFTRSTGEAHWEILLRARAIETGSYILAAAQGGFHEDGRGTWGRSLVVGPWGELVCKLDHDDPGLLVADLDIEAVSKARSAIPALVNARAFQGPDAPL